MLDKETLPRRWQSGQTITLSREGDDAPISRRGTLAAPAGGGWRRRFWGLGPKITVAILVLLVSVKVGISADWWRHGTVWKEFSHEQKLMYLNGYSAGFLAGAQQAFKNPEGLNDFYRSLAKISFRQGQVLIDKYLQDNPNKLGEPLGNLIFEAYNEAAKGTPKSPGQVLAAKSAPKPPEIPAAKDVPKAPEKVPAAKDVPKGFEEIQLGATEPPRLPKAAAEIKEVKKGEVQINTDSKGRVLPPPAAGAYTPPRGSPEREAIFVALGAYMDPSKILKLSFVVKHLKVNNGWAWIHAVPQSKDGEIQYAPVYALMHPKGGSWQVVEFSRPKKDQPDFLFSTGYLEKFTKRFPEASPDIFPRKSD